MLPEGSVCIISKRDLKSVSYNRKRITEWLWWSSSEKSRVTPVWVDTKIHKEPMLLAPKTLESNPHPRQLLKVSLSLPRFFLLSNCICCGMRHSPGNQHWDTTRMNTNCSHYISSESHNFPAVFINESWDPRSHTPPEPQTHKWQSWEREWWGSVAWCLLLFLSDLAA